MAEGSTGALRKLFLFLGVETDEKGLDRANKSLESVKKVAKSVAAVFITGALAKGFANLVQLGSEAEVSANKFRSVFEDAGDETTKSLERIGAATGFAQERLVKMAASIGVVVKTSLESAEASGKMSAGVTGLALDIATFNKVPIDEALGALRAGLTGSSIPLQKFGVNVNVAAIQQEAYRQGIRRNIKDLTEGQKVQLRYNAIIRQLETEGSLGNAAKTSKSFATASLALQTQIKGVGKTLGGILVPFAAKGTQRLLEIVKAVRLWIKINREFIRQNVVRAFRTLDAVIEGLVTSVKFLVQIWKGFGKGTVETTKAVGVMALVFIFLAAAIGLPLILLLLIGVAVLAVAESLLKMGRDGDGAIALMVTGFQDLVTETGSVGGAIEAMLGTAADAWLKFFGVSKKTREDLKLLYEDMKADFLAFVEVFPRELKILDSTLTSIAQTMNKGLSTMSFLIGKAVDALTAFFEIIQKVKKLAVGETLGRALGGGLGGVLGKALAGGPGAGALDFFSGGGGGAPGGAPVSVAAPVGGARSIQNQSSVVVNMEVNGNVDEPEVLASTVARAVDRGFEQRDRQTLQSFDTGGALQSGGPLQSGG